MGFIPSFIPALGDCHSISLSLWLFVVARRRQVELMTRVSSTGEPLTDGSSVILSINLGFLQQVGELLVT